VRLHAHRRPLVIRVKRLAVPYSRLRRMRRHPGMRGTPGPMATAARDRLARTLRGDAHPPNRLVYLLDHEYTPRGLNWRRLKGADSRRVALLRAAAGKAGCESVSRWPISRRRTARSRPMRTTDTGAGAGMTTTAKTKTSTTTMRAAIASTTSRRRSTQASPSPTGPGRTASGCGADDIEASGKRQIARIAGGGAPAARTLVPERWCGTTRLGLQALCRAS
jgi:hypothetical protein